MRCPPGQWNFSKGFTESRGRQKDLLENTEQEQISAMESHKILDVSREITPKKCFSIIQAAHLKLQFKFILTFHAPGQPEVSR